MGCSESPEQKENVTTIPGTLRTGWISHLLISPREGVREEAEGGNSMSTSTGSPTVIRGFPSSLSFTDPDDILQPASQEQEHLFPVKSSSCVKSNNDRSLLRYVSITVLTTALPRAFWPCPHLTGGEMEATGEK